MVWAAVALCATLLDRGFYIWLLSQARKKGLYPFNKPTLDDVKELLRRGDKLLAIRLYGQIYRLNHKQAALEVDLLERNLDKNNTSRP
ncbi:MAG: hypothetical protein A2Z88_06450 [Omnitrophica WOR_2 bacterium GWA2_47_8]|nr:MAG: hypothetical protein A2Z88_06450 [Omnitrophica WOR_2 bacterium GWA2_47_8]